LHKFSSCNLILFQFQVFKLAGMAYAFFILFSIGQTNIFQKVDTLLIRLNMIRFTIQSLEFWWSYLYLPSKSCEHICTMHFSFYGLHILYRVSTIIRWECIIISTVKSRYWANTMKKPKLWSLNWSGFHEKEM